MSLIPFILRWNLKVEQMSDIMIRAPVLNCSIAPNHWESDESDKRNSNWNGFSVPPQKNDDNFRN